MENDFSNIKDLSKIGFEKGENSFFELNQNFGSHYQLTVSLCHLLNPKFIYATREHINKFKSGFNFELLNSFSVNITLGQILNKIKNIFILFFKGKNNDIILSCGFVEYLLLCFSAKKFIICVHSEARYIQNSQPNRFFFFSPMFLAFMFSKHNFLFFNENAFYSFQKKFPRSKCFYIFHPYLFKEFNYPDSKFFFEFGFKDLLVVGSINSLRFTSEYLNFLTRMKNSGYNLILVGNVIQPNLISNLEGLFNRYYLNVPIQDYINIINSAKNISLTLSNNYTASSTYLDVCYYTSSNTIVYTNDNLYVDEIRLNLGFSNFQII